MSSVLHKIAEKVNERLQARKALLSESDLREQVKHTRLPFDFAAAFRDASGYKIIAEVKFASPSEGLFECSANLSAAAVAEEYLASGATALSVLAEQDFFNGSFQNLIQIREKFPAARLLMKDFMLEEYQLLEARRFGADAILLIVALLGEEKTAELLKAAKAIGLTPLVEVHDKEEFEIAERIGAELIGVNNRNLKTLDVSLSVSEELIREKKTDALLISESGISSRDQLDRLRALGYSGFLVGSAFMKKGSPGEGLQNLLLGKTS